MDGRQIILLSAVTSVTISLQADDISISTQNDHPGRELLSDRKPAEYKDEKLHQAKGANIILGRIEL